MNKYVEFEVSDIDLALELMKKTGFKENKENQHQSNNRFLIHI